MAAISSPPGGQLAGGLLPKWAPYAVFGGSAVLSAAVLAAAGSFSIALMLVFGVLVSCAGIYTWSRAVEGPRRALDRTMTMAIAAAFALAMIPLASLLFEVIKRGVPGLSLEFLTEDARGVIGGGGA